MSSRKPDIETPNMGIKKSAVSTGKLTAKPKSSQKCVSNSKIKHNGPQATNSTRLHATISRNLDETFAGSSRASLGSTEDDVEHRLAYNSYLQALFKQQLVTNQTKRHDQCMKDQLLQQNLKLQEARSTLEGIKTEIRSLENAVQINEWLQTFNNNLTALDELYSSFSITNKQQHFSNIIFKELERVSISNIKPIESQEEYNRLQTTLDNLGRVLKRISTVCDNAQEIDKLANCLKSLTLLNNDIGEANRDISELNQKTIFEFLVSTSNAFAQED